MRATVRLGIDGGGGEVNLKKISVKATRLARLTPMTIHRFPKLFEPFLVAGYEGVGSGASFDPFKRIC